MKFPIRRFRVTGKSMEPTFTEGTSVLVTPWSAIRTSDIIVARQEAKTVIKRVTKMQGAHYFLQGDNRDHTTDSTECGAIDRTAIIGKVIFNY